MNTVNHAGLCLSSRQSVAASIRQAAPAPCTRARSSAALTPSINEIPSMPSSPTSPTSRRARRSIGVIRDKTVGGEEGMANVLPGPAQHIAKAQLNLLAACQQTLTIRAGYSGEQTIFRGGPRRL